MKIALISPIEQLETSKEFSNYHMALSHLLSNKTYKSFYSNIKKDQDDAFVICDNSANEGYMIKDKQLLSCAKQINADEIIAPDKYHDAELTVYETLKFLDSYEFDIKDRYSVMAVPQGKTVEEYFLSYNVFIQEPRIDTIGIGYRNLIPAFADEIFLFNENDWNDLIGNNIAKTLFSKLEDNCFNYTLSRLFFLKKCVNYRDLRKYKKKIHLLGLYNPYELKLINSCLTKTQLNYIRSCDSASPWQAAQANTNFNNEYGVVTKPKAFLDFDVKHSKEQISIFNNNLKMLKKWAKHK